MPATNLIRRRRVLRFGYQSDAPGPDLLTRSCGVRPFAAPINIYAPIPLAATLGCCSDRRKSVGPSAPIAYATSVSPPDEAVAWPGRRYPIGNKALAWPGFRCWVLNDAVSSQGRRCWVANDAAGCPWHSSCNSPRALILVLGTSGAHWPARWPQFVLTEHGSKS